MWTRIKSYFCRERTARDKRLTELRYKLMISTERLRAAVEKNKPKTK